MKRMLWTMVALPMLLFVTGCATSNKGEIDSLESRISTLERKVGPADTQEAGSNELAGATSLTTSEVAAPESPSKEDIQAALKNAGYYEGAVDGKFGPKTKKAIEDFQAANELKADGKVGPNTWTKLRKFYVSTTTSKE